MAAISSSEPTQRSLTKFTCMIHCGLHCPPLRLVAWPRWSDNHILRQPGLGLQWSPICHHSANKFTYNVQEKFRSLS